MGCSSSLPGFPNTSILNHVQLCTVQDVRLCPGGLGDCSAATRCHDCRMLWPQYVWGPLQYGLHMIPNSLALLRIWNCMHFLRCCDLALNQSANYLMLSIWILFCTYSSYWHWDLLSSLFVACCILAIIVCSVTDFLICVYCFSCRLQDIIILL